MQAKPRILFAWEMGANFGHANKIARVAETLANDAQIFIAARNPITIRRMAPALKATILAAPFSPTRSLDDQEIAGESYPAVLSTVGWDTVQGLAALIEAWQSLFEMVRPDILVSQASPTSLLVARNRPLKTVVLGSGYDNPPLLHPMPAFKPSNPKTVTLALSQEKEVTQTAQKALKHSGLLSDDTFADLIRPDLSLLMTWPELDCYASVRKSGTQGASPYLGPVISDAVGQEISPWNEDWRTCIFAYLSAGKPEAAAAMAALNRAAETYQTIIVAPGIITKDANRLKQNGIRVYDTPVRLDQILPQCDLGVSHGSNGISSAFLKHGIPQVSLPTHREQAMNSVCLGRAGFGLGVGGEYGASHVEQLIEKVVSTKDFSQHARQFSQDLLHQTV